MAACLLWITDMPINKIEKIMTQFGGGFDGAAGPIKNLKSRTVDLLPTTVRVAELLYPGLDLTDRLNRLLVRLEIGLPPAIVGLAAEVGSRLTRGDYLRLIRAGMANIEALKTAPDEIILLCVDNDRSKLDHIRWAVVRAEIKATTQVTPPILPEYQP